MKAFGVVVDWTEGHLTVVMAVLGTAVVFMVIAGFIVAFVNRGSETIGLGFTALVGAVVLFLAQLAFQLRVVPPLEESILTQILVDHSTKQVRPYPDGEVERVFVEANATASLASMDPFPDQHQLVSDLVVYSFLSYLLVSDPDWRMKRARVEFPSKPGTHTTFWMSDPKNATILPVDSVRQALRSANNLFADVPVTTVFRELRLPRGSKLIVADGKVTIASPTMTIVVTVELSSMLGGIPKQKTPQSPIEITETGGRYMLHFTRISFRSEVARLRSRDPEMDAYRAWFDRMVAGAREWFKPSGSGLR